MSPARTCVMLLLVLLASCTAGQGRLSGTTSSASPDSASRWERSLPALDVLDSLLQSPRQTSVDELLTVEGDAFLSSNLTSAVPETAL